MLQFCPTRLSETEFRARFAKIGVGAGKTIDVSKLSPELEKSFENCMADAWQESNETQKLVNIGKVTAGQAFGKHEEQKNYVSRMLGAVNGFYGNSQAEAMYVP